LQLRALLFSLKVTPAKSYPLAPGRKLIASIAQVNGLYAIPAQTEESAHVAKLTINELHHALGHVAQGTIQYVVKQGLIEGIDNPNTTQTPECTKDEYNVKILK
jgi:hypothetical protein